MAASVYLRMFGNEIGFEHLSRDEMMNMKNKYNVKSIVSNLAKGEDISFTKSTMFMDSSVAVPTIAGLFSLVPLFLMFSNGRKIGIIIATV